MTVCTCNFSHYSVLLDDLPDDVNPHSAPCPFADEQPAVVEISDVERSTIKLAAQSVRVGDLVFDTFGGTHRVVSVRRYPHLVRIMRDDGWPITLERATLITVKRES